MTVILTTQPRSKWFNHIPTVVEHFRQKPIYIVFRIPCLSSTLLLEKAGSGFPP